MSEQQKKSPEDLRERIAKYLYEHHHPRMFDTFEELKTKYHGSAESIMQEADQILVLIHPEPKPCPEKDLPVCGLCEYWHEFHPQRSTNAKCLACYEDCKTGKQPAEQPVRPKIVCLCGSTRFVETFNEYRKKFTYDGCIVLSIEIVTSQSKKDDPQFINSELKLMLDELHKRKIDLADEVFVLNVGGYIGDSTRSEIEYATKHGKPIKYLES